MQHGSDIGVIEDGSSLRAGEFLTFTLGRQAYAIDILKVLEIRSYDRVTALPNAPAFIMGVVNIRGSVVPVVDLRVKLGLGVVEYTPFTVLVVLQLEARSVAIVVDQVVDVIALSQAQIRPAPDFSTSLGVAACILGLSALDDRMLVVVDIEPLMLSPEFALVDEALV